MQIVDNSQQTIIVLEFKLCPAGKQTLFALQMNKKIDNDFHDIFVTGLFVSDNYISDIEQFDLKSLSSSLVTLDLAGNSLTSVPEGWMSEKYY